MAYQKIKILDAQGNHIVGNPTFDENNQAVVTIAYESDEANTTGVGLNFGYSASGISIVSVENVFAGAIANGEQSGDGDAQALDFGWASLFGQFPGSETAELATITLQKIGGNNQVYLDFTSFAAGFEPLNDNPYVEPPALEISVAAIAENSGENQVIATIENGDEGDTYSLVQYAPIAPEQASNTQHVYISDSQLSDDGSQLTVTLAYKSDEAKTTGVGTSLHFDSSVLAVSSIDNVFTGAISSGELADDANNSDGNASTNQMLNFGWASIFGEFPGSNEATLATITFDIADGASGATDIGISASSNAAGFAFDGQGFSPQLANPLSIDPVTGEVTLNVNPDFESVPVYDIEIIADSGRKGAKSASIVDVDEASPVFASATAEVTIAEDAEGVIYTASADDSADVSAGVSYSLAGADAAAFSISAGGAITPVAVDYEAKTSYSVTIIANDGVTSVAEQVLTVNVTNIDEKPPIFSSLDSATVVENESAVIYEAAAADDPSDLVSNPVKYSLSDNPDNLLTIDELTGVVTLAAAPDFEVKPSYTFTVTATDNAGKSADQTVTVTVQNADEAGPLVNAVDAADLNINEDTILTPMPVGTVVYTATATDSDADFILPGPLKYSLVNVDKDSNDQPLAVINEDTGEVTLTEKPDYEGARQSYSFSVVATDAAGNHSTPHEVTLSVVNRPDAKPSWDPINAVNVDENTEDAVIYNAKAEAHSLDGQEVSIVNYELVDENGDLSSTVGPFTVSADGAVTFNGNLDYEDAQSHSFTLVATDSAGYKSDELDVTLNVNDLDELAPIVSGQLGAVELTNGTGTNQVVFDPQNSVYGESAVDNANDKSDGLVFALRFDADNQQYENDFAIDADTGQVTYLPDPSGALTINYSVIVKDAAGNVANVVDADGNAVVDADGIPVTEIALEVTILNVEYDVPVFATPEGYTAVVETEVVQKAGTINELYVDFVQSVVLDGDLSAVNSGDVVYTANTSDASTSLKYSVSSAILVDENVSNTGALFNANAAGSISINENTGAVTLVGQPWADGADSYSFTVTATDGTGNESYQIVTLTNLDSYAGAAEQAAEGVTYHIADAQAPVPVDADAVGINPESYVVDTQGLGIDPKSGDVYFVDAADYETQDRYVFKVVGSDGSEQVVSLHVVDTDDVAPVITVENTAASVDENTSIVSVVANVSAADDSAVTLSLSGDDAGSFSIDAAGVVSTKAGIKIDHELQSEYNFNVVATDAAGNSSEEAVTLQVNDLDEQGPVFTSASAIRIDENESNVIYTSAAHDAGSLVSKGAIAQEFVQNDDGTLTVKFSVDGSVYTGASQVEVADFDFTYAADHHGILKVESIEYPSNPMIRLANEQDGQINFALVLPESPPYSVGEALAEVTFKVGDPSVATTFSVSNVTLGDADNAALQVGATVNNYVMAADSSEGISFELENSDGFAIDASGNVTVSNADFETAEERSFTVVATDASGNESKQTVSVSLNDLDEVAPVFNSAAVALAIDENSGSGQVVYTATADDSADTSAGVTFSLEGADAGAFVIDADSGEVTLLDNPNFETQVAYNFAVKASDGVQSSVQAVSLEINNVDEEAPTITSGDGSEADGVDENTRFGDNEDDATNGIIYRATADDDDANDDGVTFTLADTNSEALKINDNGAVFINVAANHESLAQYTFTVVATDAAGNSSRKAVTIDVNDLDEDNPVFTSGSTALSVDENVVVNDGAPELNPVVVYKAIADDSSDISDGVTFELTADSDDLFDIISSTGEVFLTRSPDFEHKSNKDDAAAVEGYVHGFEVVALDGANATFSGRISVAINNLDEVAPKITSGVSAGTIVENSGSNQVVYTATASDVHANEAATDGFTFALGGDDADSFTIDAVTGEVSLVDNADEDTKDQYAFTVTATDAAGRTSDAETVTLTVTPESQISVAHIDSNDHISGVRIKANEVVKGVSNGRHSTAIDVDAHHEASSITLEKDIEAADVANTVNSADALMVLKMAIGLEQVAEGDTYAESNVFQYDYDKKVGVSDYDLIHMAADINQDGFVNSRDALEILKISVRMDDALESGWMFAQVASDTVEDTMSFKGFIRGDVNGSWNNSDVSAEYVNTKPVITSDDAVDVASTAEVGDVIYKVAADDDNNNGLVSYSMDPVAGLSFNVSTGAVTIADVSVLADSFAFTVTATDSEGLSSDSKVVTATVDAIDTLAPIITVDSTLDGDINEGDTGVVFKASADEAVSYTLGAGSDPALSVNAQGEVTLSNTADEDIQSEYHFTLIATDAAGNATKEAHKIEVAAIDEVAPTIVSADRAHSIDENSPGKVIYTVKATDADRHADQKVHYHLVDELNGLLSIDSVTGEVSLTGAVDYENDSEITFTVVADDGTKYSSTKDVTIAINDVDEQAPVLTIEDTAENVITDTALSIEEHSGAGQLVFKASATDVHEGLEAKSNGVSFSLAEEGDYQAFTIDAKTGEVRLNVDPDREGDSPQSSYTITVIASDGQDQSSQTVTLNIDDIDEVAPVITLNAVSSSVEENSDAGHVAYSVSASDDSTFALFLSADSDSAVSLENGNIVLNESPDHEMQREYNFTVVATDSEGNSSSESGSISVVDVDDTAPTMNAETKGSIVEGDHEGTVLYSADASDAADDKGSQLSYELVVNTALVIGSAEPVEADSGVQKVYVGSDTVQDGNQIEVDVDYLADSNELTGLGLRVHYDSSLLSFVEMNNVFSEDLIFESENFVNANNPADSYVSVAWASHTGDWTGGELPENLFSAVFDVLTDETTATQISFSAIDNDMAYDFAGVAHDIKLSPLSIDSQGNVSLDSDFKADFESLSEIEFTVVATDSANNVTSRDVVISVENKDEKPPVIDSGSDAGVIVENTGAGQLIYTATSVDTDDVSQSTTTYKLEDANASLIINSQTGDVYLLDNPDYKAGDPIAFTVVAKDDAGSSSKVVTLSVSNLDEEAPVITSGLAGDNVDENAPGSKVVYTATAVNNTDTFGVSDLSVSYSLASDSDAAFSINADSGVVSFNEIADYETKADYSFTVVATDISGESTSQTVTVGVNDLDEVAPIITSSASAGALNETHETNESFSPTVVYTATASDVHGDEEKATSDTITFALSGADASAFSIDSSTGVVTLTQSPNFEAQSSYSFDVVATEGTFRTDPVTGEYITDPVTGEVLIKPGNSSTAETVTLTINNVDEVKPEITSSDTAKAVSDSAAVIYKATAEDSGDGSNGNITFSLTDESVVSINADGEVTVNSDANLSSVVDFTVVATDANGNSSEKAVSIPVISDVTTVSPAGTPDEDNNGIVHSYTNNSNGSVTLKLAIGTRTGMSSDAELTNIDFELSSTSAIYKDDFVVSSEPTMHIATQVDPNTIRVSQVYMNGYDTSAGEAILEYTIDEPAGDTFSVSSITMGALDEMKVDSSSTLAVLPEIVGSDGDDVVVLKDGFANVDLDLGADTLIIDPDYNANMVIDFVSGVDSIDMTRILDDADYGEGDALQVSGSTPDIADLVSNGDESLDNAFGGYFNDDTDVLTLFVDADKSAGVTNVESIEVTLSENSDFNDDDLSVNFVHFIA